MRYFKYFPSLQFDMDGNNQYRTVVDVFRMAAVDEIIGNDVSFYRYYDVQDGERPDHVSYTLYGAVDYYWTFFVINNNLKNVYTDWPLSQAEVDEMVEEKYSGTVLTFNDCNCSSLLQVGDDIQGLISGATATIAEKNTTMGWMRIENITGGFVAGELVRNPATGNFIEITGERLEMYAAHHFELDGEDVPRTTPLAVPVTFREYENELNENKRQIRVIRPEHVQKFAAAFRKVINE